MSAGYQGLDKDEIKKLESSHHHEDIQPLITPASSEYDQLLMDVIYQKLRDHTEIHNQDIKIHIQEGVVTLYGKIATYEEKATIGAIVENVIGVRETINLLEFDFEGAIEKNLSGHASLSLPRKDL